MARRSVTSTQDSNNANEEYTNSWRVWKDMPQLHGSSPGFKNSTRARCYFNSVVIALLHAPSFFNWLHWHKGHHRTAKRCVACTFAHLSQTYWTLDSGELESSIQLLIVTLDIGWPEHLLEIQQDPQEFYTALINLLSKEWNNRKRLQTMFQSTIQSKSECTVCRHPHVPVPETNNNLIVSCYGIKSVDQGLDQCFESGERPLLECDSEVCKKAKRTKRFTRTLDVGPEILCIQINRFKHNGEKLEKNTSHIEFGEYLDLTRFLHNKDGTTLRYRLVTAVHHSGTKDFGHYITVAKTPAGPWVRHDDERVDKVDLREALRPTDNEFTPYLLFWQKEPETPGNPESPKHPGKRPRTHDDHNASEESPTKSTQNKNGSRRTPSWDSDLFGSEHPNSQETPSKRIGGKEHRTDLTKLVIRAAEAHKSLIESAHNLNAGLDTALRTLATLSPLMKELRTKKKYRVRAKAYLDAEISARRFQTTGLQRIQKSPQLRELVDVGEQSRKALQTFLKSYRKAFQLNHKESIKFLLRVLMREEADEEDSGSIE